MIKLKKLKKAKMNKSPDIHKEIRHLGVIIESIDSKVGLVAEQYGEIKKDMSDVKKDINDIKITLNSHTETLSSHTETLNSHTEMVGKLAVDMAIVKEDVEFIKSGLKKKIDIEEFSALERRVALLEKHQ